MTRPIQTPTARTTADRPTRRGPRRVPARRLILLAAGLSPIVSLTACTADQVFDPARYWADRVAGATIDADPSGD